MDTVYFQPKAGQKYLNRNGITYFCIEGLGFNSAKFISITSGYTLTAHGCQKNDDGTIEWIGSIGGKFENVRDYIEEAM